MVFCLSCLGNFTLTYQPIGLSTAHYPDLWCYHYVNEHEKCENFQGERLLNCNPAMVRHIKTDFNTFWTVVLVLLDLGYYMSVKQ